MYAELRMLIDAVNKLFDDDPREGSWAGPPPAVEEEPVIIDSKGNGGVRHDEVDV
jgi:hypothetical protein